MVAVILSISILTILYRTAYSETLREVEHAAELLAGVTESITEHPVEFPMGETPAHSREITLLTLFNGLREKGQLRKGDEIVIGESVPGGGIRIMHRDVNGEIQSLFIPRETMLAEPLRRAVDGNRGSGELIDYKGDTVIAGYAPVPALRIGLVYKRNLDDVRAPYIAAGFYAGIILIVAIGLISGILMLFVRPLQQRIGESDEREKAAIDALRASERRLSQALAATTDSTWEWNLTTGETFYSARWYEMLGYLPNEFEMTFEKWKEICHPDDYDQALAAIRSVQPVQTAKGYEVDFRVRDKKGDWRWIRGRGNVVVRKRSGQPLLISGTNTDITARKVTEEALRASEQFVRHITETMPGALCVIDVKNKRQVFTRKSVASLAGFKSEEDFFPGSDSFMEAMHPEDRPGFWKMRTAVTGQPEGSVVQCEYRIGHGSDALWLQQWETIFQTDHDGKPTHMLCVIQDVTARKRAEIENVRKSQELERFAYTVSHDLKTPLVTIKSYAGFAREDVRNNDQVNLEKDIHYIEKAADKMDSLLSELLEFTRIGRKEQPRVPCVLNDLVSEAREIVAGRLTKAGAQVHVHDLPYVVVGERPRLIELFQNLLDNAAKFTSNQSAPRIEIGTELDGMQRIFFVRDNGIGVDPRHKSRLFGLFEKLDPTAEGTGMGLAIAQRIVQLHGGTIWFHSDGPGCGTTFYFTLPPEAP